MNVRGTTAARVRRFHKC